LTYPIVSEVLLPTSLAFQNSFFHFYAFSFSFFLVMGWIKAEKSVIICAPTSSGKTVLSSIVALIGKHNTQKDGNADQKSVKKVAEGSAKVTDDLEEISGDEDEEDEDGEGEGEGEEGEYDEDDEDEGEEEADLRRLNLKGEQGQGERERGAAKAALKDQGINSEQVSLDFALRDRMARFKFRYVPLATYFVIFFYNFPSLFVLSRPSLSVFLDGASQS
jgi:hypothetical protein